MQMQMLDLDAEEIRNCPVTTSGKFVTTKLVFELDQYTLARSTNSPYII